MAIRPVTDQAERQCGAGTLAVIRVDQDGEVGKACSQSAAYNSRINLICRINPPTGSPRSRTGAINHGAVL
jgi:hypothetical protein